MCTLDGCENVISNFFVGDPFHVSCGVQLFRLLSSSRLASYNAYLMAYQRALTFKALAMRCFASVRSVEPYTLERSGSMRDGYLVVRERI